MQAKYFALWITVLAPAWALANPPERGLLEFLGTVDSESREWNRYLVATSPDKAVVPPAQSVSVNPVTPAKPTEPVPPAKTPVKTPVKTPLQTAPPLGNPAQPTPAVSQPIASK